MHVAKVRAGKKAVIDPDTVLVKKKQAAIGVLGRLGSAFGLTEKDCRHRRDAVSGPVGARAG